MPSDKILRIGGKKVVVKDSKSSKRKKLATKSYVDRAIRSASELKYSTIALSSVSASTTVNTQTWTSVSSIVQGSTDQQRVGDSIELRSLHIKGTINYADSTNLIRIIVFLWRPLLGDVTPTAGSVLSATTWAANPTMAYYNVDRSRRPKQAKILYDKVFSVNSVSSPQKKFSFNHLFKKPVNMNFAAGSATDAWNCPVVQIVSDSAAASHPTVIWSGRLYYTDS